MRALERYLLLQIIDQRWREHLYDMDYLREGIHLRGFAQIEPLVAYKNEAFTLFEDLMNSIWSDFARMIYNVEVEVQGENGDGAAAAAAASAPPRGASARSTTRAARWRTSRAPTARPTARRRRASEPRRSCSSAASTSTSRSAATTRAGAGRARSSRSATAPERRALRPRAPGTARPTTCGSNCVPAWRCSSLDGELRDRRATRYGRSEVIASNASATRTDPRLERDVVAGQAVGVAGAVVALVVVAHRSATRSCMSAASTMSPPSSEWRFISSNSASVSAAGLLRIASGTPILPTSCSRPPRRTRATRSRLEPELGGDHRAQLRHRLAVAARVGVLGVDGESERARQRDARRARRSAAAELERRGP